jgi:RHS repeat-associated protein
VAGNVVVAFRFEGQEGDNEVYGPGNAVSYKYRVHDPRLGRFLSLDPLAAEYPFYSPYAFSGNRVIDSRELEGLEPEWTADGTVNHTLEESDAGSGPTDLTLKFGNMDHWRTMVDDPKNSKFFGHITDDRYNPHNPAYKELNVNVGDKVYNRHSP